MIEIHQFIEQERRQFLGQRNNTFAIMFSKVVTYRSCLNIIMRRYEASRQEFMKLFQEYQRLIESAGEGTRIMTEEEVGLMQAENVLIPELHLDIESFYLFSKILLDHLARAVEFYFGHARGLSLDSHDDFTKNIERYAQNKSLMPCDTIMIELMRKLKRKIADFRDYVIVHEKGPYMHGATFISKEGIPTIGRAKFGVNSATEQKRSEPLHELLDDVDRWIRDVLRYLQFNSNKAFRGKEAI